MKVVVIGGGIAGFAAALAMKKIGHDVVVREKYPINAKLGMAFLVHSSTLDDMHTLATNSSRLSGHPVDDFYLLNATGNKQKKIDLNNWQSIMRFDLIKFLAGQLEEKEFQVNSNFSHFEYEGKNAVAAVFKDGSIEKGDLFIGADGVNSKVRQVVTESDFFPSEISEVVCLTDTEVAPEYKNTFRKYQSEKSGLSFGIVPLSEDYHVWFSQFDKKLFNPIFEKNDEDIRASILELFADFPSEVTRIMKKSDLKGAHLWVGKELKLLECYFRNNICLVGDAAHSSVSLTSSGVASGVSSAMHLAEALETTTNLREALLKYEERRTSENGKKIEYAQVLKKQFLEGLFRVDNYKLPLMS